MPFAFVSPYGIAALTPAVVYVADTGNHIFQKFVLGGGVTGETRQVEVYLGMDYANGAGSTVRIRLSDGTYATQTATWVGSSVSHGTAVVGLHAGGRAVFTVNAARTVTSLQVTKLFTPANTGNIKANGLSGIVELEGVGVEGASVRLLSAAFPFQFTGLLGDFAYDPVADIGSRNPVRIQITATNP